MQLTTASFQIAGRTTTITREADGIAIVLPTMQTIRVRQTEGGGGVRNPYAEMAAVLIACACYGERAGNLRWRVTDEMIAPQPNCTTSMVGEIFDLIERFID